MSLLSSVFGNRTQVINLDSDTFNEQMKNDKDAVLIDVRTLAENEEQRIPNSILLDIMSPVFVKELDKLDRSKSYYMYCRSGSRSHHAAKQMLQMGFEKVYNLADGIIRWNGEVE
ncbi:MAG: rhodanese-like domain-containing protein [Melioribacteraceae bacterium]|nr:rhodanese-like domain-containing protein [Melioribacteraceae bacterium]